MRTHRISRVKLIGLCFILISNIMLLPSCGQAETPPVEIYIEFSADRTTIQTGECTRLAWHVEGGFGVSLNGEEVPEIGEREVCLEESRVFELAVDAGTHQETRTVEISVSGAPVSPGEDQPGGDQAPVTPGIPAYQAGTWVYTGGPLGGLGYDVRMDPRNPDVMYVTDGYAGVFKSTNGGQDWFPINNGIPPYFGPSNDVIPVFSLTIDPNHPDTLWAGLQYNSGIFRSDDGGETWKNMNKGNNGIIEKSLSTRGFTIEPGNSDVVYFAGEVSSFEWNNGISLSGLGLDMTKGVVYKTTDGGQTWTRLWYGENLARYIWIHPQDHTLIYVSTGIFDREAANSSAAVSDPGGVGILRSHDGGQTWEVLDADNGFDPHDFYIGSLFMHPEDPDILLAAAGNDPYQLKIGHPLGGIYRTIDGGDTWTETLDGHNFSSVEICTGDPDIAYASARTNFFCSEDRGQTWQQVAGDRWGPADAMVGWPIDMQCDPRDALRIYVNAYGGGVFLSEDGGATWSTASRGYTGALMREVAVASDDPARVFVSARSGIFASTDGGENWLGLNIGPARDLEAYALAMDPLDSNHIIATYMDTGLKPKVSFDGGKTWEEGDATFAAAGDDITRIVFSLSDPSLLLASVGDENCHLNASACQDNPGGGIIFSHDGGRTWAQSSLDNGQVQGLAFSGDGQSAFAVLADGQFHRSNDGGQTWQLVSSNLTDVVPPSQNPDAPQLVTYSLAVDPSNPEKIFVGFYGGALAISTDGGLTWTPSASGMSAEAMVNAIVVDPTNPQVVYAGTLNGGVYFSLDGGQIWSVLNDGLLTRAVRSLALSRDGSVLYMTSEGAGVFRLGTPGR
jgi:photosystem II stability/assembly factor-like uncharacterized protein